jgi:hypothetical protein
MATTRAWEATRDFRKRPANVSRREWSRIRKQRKAEERDGKAAA